MACPCPAEWPGKGASRRSGSDLSYRCRSLEHGLGDQVVSDRPCIARGRVETIAKYGGQRREESVTDDRVVTDAHSVAHMPRTELAGNVQQSTEPWHGLHDLAQLVGEPGLLQGLVCGEQRAQGRIPAEQLLVEPHRHGGQLRADALERRLHQRDLFRSHESFSTARASSARLVTPSLA